MVNNKILRGITILAAIGLVAILAWLSSTDEDPCANPQSDISAAVLADSEGDQDALTNRAMLMKSECAQQ